MSTNNELDLSLLTDISDLPGVGDDKMELTPVVPLVLTPVESNPNDRKVDIDQDYQKVRENYYFQSQMLMDAAKLFLESAKNADSPRHMEVFATLMGQMNTTNKDFIKLHKEMREITDEKPQGGNAKGGGQMSIGHANVFVGSSSELMDSLMDEEMKDVN